MTLPSRLISLGRNLFRRARVEQDLDEELQAHLDLLVAAAIERGADPAEARRQARLELGGMEQVKEEVRAIRVGHWLETLRQDLRYGIRALGRSPAFTLTVVLTLALGIAANSAIFGLINATLLRPLPVPAPEQLVMFSEGPHATIGGPLKPGRLALFSYPLFERLRAENQTFQGLAAQQSGEIASAVQVSGGGGDAAGDLAFGRAVSANYFQVLGLTPHLGRLFGSDDQTASGANPVVVLSHDYWQRRFGSKPAAVGAVLAINGTTYTVVGVGPPRFAGTRMERTTDFWVPATMQASLWRASDWLARDDRGWLLIIGRLRPGVALPAAEANVNVILQRFLADHPAQTRPGEAPKVRIVLDPGAGGVSDLRPRLRLPLLALLAGSGLLLLIVCFNLSHLMLARAAARQREMSIRAALGASRGRLLRQLLTESLLLSAFGAVAAVVLARWITDGLLALLWTEGTSLALDVRQDRWTLSFTALLALGCGVLLGLVPGLHGWRRDVQAGLRLAPATVAGGGQRHRLVSGALLSSQVALSLILIVGAGLVTESLRRLRRVDKGFDDRHTLLVELNTRMTGLKPPQTPPLYDDLLARVLAVPGVQSASLSPFPVLTGGMNMTRVCPPGTTSIHDSYEVPSSPVTPAYFQTLGMTLRRGRGFTRSDNANAPHVAVMNESAARRQFGSTDVVGKRFLIPKTPPEEFEVVGVVADAKGGGYGLRELAPAMLYMPAAQHADFLNSLEVRSAGDPAALAAEIRRVVRESNASLPVLSVRTLHQQVERSLAGDRILATLATAFGLAALLLVCLGLYGVISQWAAQRTGEIGVRLALGATPSRVRRMVLGQALRLLLVGVAIGLPVAWWLSHLARQLLFGVQPMEPLPFVLAVLVLLAVATLAAYLPARRAARVDPMVALRWE
jgi:predicted permease